VARITGGDPADDPARVARHREQVATTWRNKNITEFLLDGRLGWDEAQHCPVG
jgi:hypothetical protein